MHEKGKNLSIFIIVMMLSFAACVGFGLYENFAKDSNNLLKMVGSEAGDVCITGENLEDLGKDMESWEQVEKVLYYTSVSIKLESGEESTSVSCDVWEDPEAVQNEMVIEGRVPKYDNEITLTTSIAKLLNVEVGDIVYVTGQKDLSFLARNNSEFLVCILYSLNRSYSKRQACRRKICRCLINFFLSSRCIIGNCLCRRKSLRICVI